MKDEPKRAVVYSIGVSKFFKNTKGEISLIEVDVEYLNKWASLTGERARLEANLFNSYIVYMNKNGDVVKEHANGEIEIIEEATEEI